MKMDKRNIENAAKTVGAGEKSGSQLLQFAVICLAIASFFTTAQGMRSYIFNGEPTIAYMTSGAIQGILLALSMNLPRFMRRIWNEKSNVFIKAIIEIVLLILTGISLFCSSWFSYVYIAETVHKGSWDTDSELLVQQIYRNELYDASDYSKAYRTYLEAELGQEILNLQSLANQLPTQASDFNMDWESEQQQYASDNTVASSYMTTAINQLKLAFETAPSQENRDLAEQAVTEAQKNIEVALKNEQTRLGDVRKDLSTYNDQISNLNQQIRNATTQAEITSLQETLRSYQETQSTAAAQQQTIQQEISALQNAQGRLNVYAVNLGLSNSTSSISIKRNLLEMQTELFKDDPDVDSLRNLATETFSNLRNAESLSAGSEGENSLSYNDLLTRMNTLVLNLNDYASIKSIETTLNDLTNGLQRATTSTSNTKWKSVWQTRIENLKAQISALPTFVTSSADVSEITESQQRILTGFDRTESCANLDNATRRYINDHNALEQGTIYLTSPYKGLALFALVLAFFLDLSGFVFGVVDLGAKENKNDSGISGNNDRETIDVPKIFKSMKEKVGENESQWSIRPTANSYKVVTGNFRCEDGVYYYGVFENGIHKEWKVVDDHAYHEGIYLVDNVAARKGVALSEKHQDVIFSNQGFEKMPQDGVYLNGTLSYHEGSLLFEAEVGGKSDKSAENDASPYYIANVEEYVPVHCYAPKRGENITQPAIDLAKFPMKVKVAVLALNPDCTRIVAMYLILRE
jgi:hypothetical protein